MLRHLVIVAREGCHFATTAVLTKVEHDSIKQNYSLVTELRGGALGSDESSMDDALMVV